MTSMDEVYSDRNQAAMLAAAIARDFGFEVGLRIDPDEPDWPVLTIVLPKIGQVSWHLPREEARMVAGLPTFEHEWDGHSTEEKRLRIETFVRRWIGSTTESRT